PTERLLLKLMKAFDKCLHRQDSFCFTCPSRCTRRRLAGHYRGLRIGCLQLLPRGVELSESQVMGTGKPSSG
ncbi:MAG: hypothetical protein VB858_07340, partial [Planctomycetaceae bacterium]